MDLLDFELTKCDMQQGDLSKRRQYDRGRWSRGLPWIDC